MPGSLMVMVLICEAELNTLHYVGDIYALHGVDDGKKEK
jgi:hypothetical protein